MVDKSKKTTSHKPKDNQTKNAKAAPITQHPTITEEYIATAQAQRLFQKYTTAQGTRLFSVLGAALGLSLVLNFYNASKPTEYRYIAVTPDGRIIPLVPLSQPLPSSFDIGYWASQKAQQLFSLDYRNYKSQLSNSEQYFTSAGWRGFEKALSGQNLLSWIDQNRYTIKTTIVDAPVIESQGVMPGNGMYGWQVSFHLNLSMSSGNGANDQEVTWKVTMLVMRAPQTISPDGVQIQNVVISREN